MEIKTIDPAEIQTVEDFTALDVEDADWGPMVPIELNEDAEQENLQSYESNQFYSLGLVNPETLKYRCFVFNENKSFAGTFSAGDRNELFTAEDPDEAQHGCSEKESE